MTIENARWANKEHTIVTATIDGVQYTMPGEVVETNLRGPATPREVPDIDDETGQQRKDPDTGERLTKTEWDDGELTGEKRWTSGNIHRQMVADEYENKGIPLPEYEPPPVTEEMVQAEADRRIEALIPARARLRAMTEDVPLPANIKAQARAIRAKADALANRANIPADYADEQHWS